MIVADDVARTLALHGVERVYGLPGEDHMELLDSLERFGISYWATANESSAVLMCATEALATGQPGVCLLSLAPGVSNGINGLLHAYMEQAPIVVLSGQHTSSRLPFVVRQGFDIEELVRPVTRWTGRLAQGTDVWALLSKAIEIAASSPSGPVYVEVPADIMLGSSWHEDEQRASWTTSGRNLQAEPLPAATATLGRLEAAIADARRPALIVGGRASLLQQQTVATFAEAYRCPVFTTSTQKGLMSSRNDWYAGTFLNGRLETEFLAQADLVIAINPEAREFYNKPWAFPGRKVCISNEAMTEWVVRFDQREVADPEPVLAALAKTNLQPSASEWTKDEIATYRTSARAALVDASSQGMSVPQAIAGALHAFPADGYVTADAGFGKPILAMLAELDEPRHYFASNGLSTMGFSIPAGIALARSGHTPVLSLVGDGSLLMRATELAFMQQAPEPLVVLALMDRSLTQIEVKQRRRGLATVGAELPAFTCSELGAALGVRGLDVDSRDGVQLAVADALLNGGTTLIGAHVDGESSRALFEVLRG